MENNPLRIRKIQLACAFSTHLVSSNGRRKPALTKFARSKVCIMYQWVRFEITVLFTADCCYVSDFSLVLVISQVKENNRKESHQAKMKEITRVKVLMMKMTKMDTGDQKGELCCIDMHGGFDFLQWVVQNFVGFQ